RDTVGPAAPSQAGRADVRDAGPLGTAFGSARLSQARLAQLRAHRQEAVMTTAAEGTELTQVGPGTPMGELMRLYWMPALKASELERDGAPVRFMLLGEKLIAFRDTGGRVGVMDHRCPHRCASLFLGRNEEGGIRCLYHGWKFDTSGQCIDMPSVP